MAARKRKSKHVANINSKRKAAEERLAAAQAKLSADDRAEIEERDQISKLTEDAKIEEEKARQLDLQRRLDAAEAALGSSVRLTTVAIEGMLDSFIVQCEPHAHTKWENDLSRMASSGKGERSAIHRAYAQAVVYDWNGSVRNDTDSEFTTKLVKFLSENPGVVTPLTDAAIRLAGAVASEHKS
jgi:hypothetical protein